MLRYSNKVSIENESRLGETPHPFASSKYSVLMPHSLIRSVRFSPIFWGVLLNLSEHISSMKLSSSISTQATPSTANSSSKLNIFLHDCYALSMDGAEIGVLEQMDQESFSSFLERLDCMRLPSQLGADLGGEEVQGDLADESRKG